MQSDLKAEVDEARDSVNYATYQTVRDRVLMLTAEAIDDNSDRSDYWNEETASFGYLFDAGPLIVKHFREHCYHITGVRSYDYRQHHEVSRRQGYLTRFDELSALEKRDLFVPESPALGGFGFDTSAGLINVDSLKYYEVLIGLDKAGLLDSLTDESNIIEIGAGWGGFGYQFHTKFPSVGYIIIDLPHTLLFSMFYLSVLFPDATMAIHGDPGFSETLRGGDFDFAFVPSYATHRYSYPGVNFGVNICSFQEMTIGQISSYAELLYKNKCAAIYSLNRDRSSWNNQLFSVRAELEKFYHCETVKILDTAYTSINSNVDSVGGDIASDSTGKNMDADYLTSLLTAPMEIRLAETIKREINREIKKLRTTVIKRLHKMDTRLHKIERQLDGTWKSRWAGGYQHLVGRR